MAAVQLVGCGDGPIVGPGLEPPGEGNRGTYQPASGSSSANTPPALGAPQGGTTSPSGTPGPAAPSTNGAMGPASGGTGTATTGGGAGAGMAAGGDPGDSGFGNADDSEPPPPVDNASPGSMAPGMAGAGATPPADDPAITDPPVVDAPVCDRADALRLRAELAFLPVLSAPSSTLDDGWAPLRSALSELFAESDSSGMTVAVYASAGAGGAACPTGAQLLSAPMALPQPALGFDVALLFATGVAGGRQPVAQVLQQVAARQQTQATDAASAVVLLTDAEPTTCEGSAAELADLAADAQPVKTYVIAFGDYVAAYDEVASAGGTGEARQAALDPGALLDALRAIRSEVRDCTFGLPDMAGGFDASLMRLTMTDASGQERAILAVPDRDACAGGEAFYFDRPAAPARLHVCPAVCDQLADGASLQTETLCSPGETAE